MQRISPDLVAFSRLGEYLLFKINILGTFPEKNMVRRFELFAAKMLNNLVFRWHDIY